MSDEVPVNVMQQSVVACEVCGRGGDVPWYCKNCPGSLCDACKLSHQETAISRRHAVVPRTGEVLRLHGPARIAEQCHKHKTYELSTYCNECQVACCVDCLVEGHKRHDFSSLSDAYLAAEGRLNDYIKQLQTEVKVQLQGMLTETQEMVGDHADHVNDTKDEVNAFREEVKQAVENAFDSIVEKVVQPHSDLAEIINKLKLDIQSVDELISECVERIREGKSELLSYIPPAPSSFLPTMSLPHVKYPLVVTQRKVLHVLEQDLVTIKYKDQTEEPNYSDPNLIKSNVKNQGQTEDKSSTDPNLIKSNVKNQGQTEDKSSPVPNLIKSNVKNEGQTEDKSSPVPNLIKSNVKNQDQTESFSSTDLKMFKSEVGATSITVAGNRTAWVMYHSSDTMYLYNDCGKKVRSVTVRKGVDINAMALTPSGEMIVASEDKKLRCVSASKKVSTLLETAPYGAKGVCLTDRGEIVVCMSGQGEKNHVAVYSSDGRKKTRELSGKDTQGRKLITDPYCVVQNGKDLCVVNDGHVVCLDERGVVMWLYDGSSAKMREAFNPRGICKDKHHNVLVTDFNNSCVHYISRKGQLIKLIMKEIDIHLQNHHGISVDDETEQVWVGNVLKGVVIANYLGV